MLRLAGFAGLAGLVSVAVTGLGNFPSQPDRPTSPLRRVEGGLLADGAQGSTSLPSDLSGTITFDFVNWIRHETEAIVDVTLPDGELRRSASGRYGWRHPDGDLVHSQGCGSYVNRLVRTARTGRSDVITPCSSEIETISAGKPMFEFSRLSPDKRRVAAELKYYVSPDWRYSVVVYEDTELIAAFDGFAAPAWLPDGRLLLAGDGLYVTQVEGTPQRLDDGWLGVGVNNVDVNPAGDILAFEWSERLWIMDAEGTEYKELVAGPATYRFPAWSPDGNYVAFLAMSGAAHSEVDRALHFIDIRVGELHRVDISAYGGPLNHVPFGPLSWNP